MYYVSSNEIAQKWGITSRRVQSYCVNGRIKGATKVGVEWLIPSDSKKPVDKRKKSLNVIDLFCGAGGLSYGLQSAGFNILLGVDNDKKALETFKLNHKKSKVLCDDMTKINYHDIKNIIGNKKIDFIIGGPPCQGMSLSGPRKFDDPRNKLYLSYLRILNEVQPRGFVIENVPGLLSLFNGKIKDSIITRLSKIGYNVNYRILKSSDYGVPQNRKRVILVGLKKGKFNFPLPNNNIITTKMALNDLPPLNNKEYLGTYEQDYLTDPQNMYQTLMRKNSNKVYNHIAAKHADKTRHIISLVPDGGNYKNLPEKYKKNTHFHTAWTRFNSNRPSPTIDTGHRHHFHYKYNRVPTVRESARLQSFPDDFIFLGNKTQQFRQVGNAVPPLMAQYIAEKLKNY